jgi:hypothetical protein
MRPLLLTLLCLTGLSLSPASHAEDPAPPETAGELARYPNAPSATGPQKVWIDTVIKQNYDRVNACHRDALKRDPRQVAFYNVMLQLGGDGIVRWGEIKATTSGDPLLDECVLEALKTMDYSRADTHEAFVVAHTMVLTPMDYPHEPALMKKNRASVEACYAEAQARVAPADLRGVMAVRFVTREGKSRRPGDPHGHHRRDRAQRLCAHGDGVLARREGPLRPIPDRDAPHPREGADALLTTLTRRREP